MKVIGVNVFETQCIKQLGAGERSFSSHCIDIPIYTQRKTEGCVYVCCWSNCFHGLWSLELFLWIFYDSRL